MSASARYAGRLGEPDQLVAAAHHVVWRAERVHVVAAETLYRDPAEHVAEIEIALARRQVHLVAVPEAVCEPHLLDPVHIDRVDEAGHALGHEMRVVGGEGQLEGRSEENTS